MNGTMKTPQQKTNKLNFIVLLLLIVGIGISCYTLYYAIQNKDEFKAEIQQNLRAELDKLNIPTPKDISVDEARLVLAVAEYCKSNNDCRGQNGQSIIGLTGSQGLQGPQGLPGIQGEQGVKGENGNNGLNGTDGRTPTFRCNQNKNQWQVRYSEDENWSAVINENGNPSRCQAL